MERAIAVRVKKLAQPISCVQCRRYIREESRMFVIGTESFCELCGDPDMSAQITDFDRASVIARIKAGLTARSGRPWSVTGGKGTAYGWLRISAPKKRMGCARLHDFDIQTYVCKTCGKHRNQPDIGGLDAWHCEAHVCGESYSCRGEYVVPEDRAELARLLGVEIVHQQGVQVMASHDAYVEFIDRAEGRQPRTIAQAYWE